MYKELNKLRKYTEKLDDVIHLIYSHIRNSGHELRKEDASEIKKLSDKLKKKDVYILLEAIYSTSLTFEEGLMKELEDKFSYLVFKWADIYEKYHAHGGEFDIDLYNWVDVINEQLIKSIDNINRFCVNYLSKTESSLFSGVENIIIAVANKDYLKAKQRYHELRHYGINALTKEDQFNMLMLEIDNSENYVEGLISEGIDFDIAKYEIEFEEIERIKEVVKQDDFKVYFVSERKLPHDYVMINEEVIFEVYKYLITNRIIAEVGFDYFISIIVHKKLPNNSPQILWDGTMADARRFVDFFKLNDIIFNMCFLTKKEKLLDKNVHKLKKNDTSKFSAMLAKIVKQYE